MKRLGTLLVLLTVSMFALGCEQPKPPAPPAPQDSTAPAEPTTEPVADPPAEGEAK